MGQGRDVPRLSVLMPVRNGEATVGLAVRSTLRAMPRDSELVVLDDASTDRTRDLLAAHADRRFRVLTSPVPVGVGEGLRRLVDSTDSAVVARMDADDVTLPGRFTWELGELRRDADFCFTPIVRFRTKPFRLRPGLPAPISAEAMPFHMLVHNPLCHPTLVATRDAVVAAGSYRAVLAEDHDLWLRALAAGLRMVRIAVPFLAYRQHPAQLSGDPGFALKALNQTDFQDSYTALARRVLGVEPTWLGGLWPREAVDAAERAAALGNFRALVEARSSHLSGLQRRILARTLSHLGSEGR